MRYGDYLRVLERFQTPWLAPFTTEMPAEETVCTSSQYKRHLQSKGVHFVIVKHAKAYTASAVAAEAKVSGHKLAKTVRRPIGCLLLACSVRHHMFRSRTCVSAYTLLQG